MKSKPRILVIGDKCADHYTYGNVTRLCPDVPAPVFIPKTTIQTDGMAGNVTRQFEEWGCIVDKKYNTEFICKHKYIDEKTNHTIIRVDTENNVSRIDSENLDELVHHAEQKWDAIVVSDYGKGFLHQQDIKKICESHPLVFVDTKKTLDHNFKSCAFIKINEPEWIATKDNVSPEVKSKVIVTLGGNGCMYNGKNYPVIPVDVFDLSGAGDTFMCGLVISYIHEKDIDKAIWHANDCACRVVQKKGVATIEI
jgi:D-beta-D-heptose 7-phosphate kinase/D-beta-D-heptose 1-phosphate adenosyltransferase